MKGAALLALLVAPLLASAAESPRVDARIAASAAAAQSLQGPLDGTWTLTDAGERTLYVIQIADPAAAGEDLQGAWRAPGGGLGVVTTARRRGDHLDLVLDVRGAPVRVSLNREARGWRGALREGGRRIPVILRRG